METKQEMMNSEGFYNMPDAIFFIDNTCYKKRTISKHHRQVLRQYKHKRKVRRKNNKEKWAFKDIVVGYH